MNKNYNLKLDLQFRCNNSIMKFNQFDNNTSDFFMRITNGGNLVDIEKALVVLAVIKPSGKVASQFVEVKNDVIYADLKPSMKDEIGTYTAKAMLILEDERVVTDSISYEVEEDKIFSLLNDSVEDTEEFTLLTDMLSRLSTVEISEDQRVINEAERILSEENRKTEEAERVEAELVRQHEEADRAKYDATRESNENIRKQNEEARISSENVRLENEAKRVEEEANRVEAEQLRKDNYNFMTEDEERRRSEANAHKEAEKLRAQAEITRVNSEAKRRTTEQARVSAENTRVNSENIRKANEEERKSNETQRVEAETQRQNRYNSLISDAEANVNDFGNYTNTAKVKEEERKSNELDRKSQEAKRVSNEVERISNENTRKANEKAREKNETSRQYVFENKVDEVDKKIIEINTTKDNFISSISTKVDTKISEIDNVKDNFVSSVNTKVDNKISELDNAKSDMTNTVSNKVNEVETRFNALTSSQQQDAEVIDARDGETSLKVRLDRDIEKAKQVYVNVEGSHISTDSSVGYLKDIEILGNTIQSASNLADIKSVGDKVEGQELYEIPVLIKGKNLFDGKYLQDVYINSSGITTPNASFDSTDYIQIKPNTTFTISKNSKIDFVDVYYYDINKIFIKVERLKTFTTPTNCKYVRFGNLKGFFDNNIQLEEGTVATPYEPYIEDKLTILSPVQLEKVGDVRDRIIEKDGVWGVEKNVASFTLNGTENWVNGNYDTVNHVSYRALMPKPLKYTNQYATSFIGSFDGEKLAWFYIYNDKKDVQGYGYGDNGFFYFRVPNTKTIEDFKQDLSNNPIFVLGCANEPQFIPLPHDQQIKLRTFANKTNISFLTEIEGTIKAQVPKSLGATVNTHTEQISNLNKELDRVKKLEESTVSTVTTESDFTTVEATSNGYFEDVKLEGKTLVNLISTTRSYISSDNTEIHKDVNIDMTTNKILTIQGKANKVILLEVRLDGLFSKNIICTPVDGFINTKIVLSSGENIRRIKGISVHGWNPSEESSLFNDNFILLEGDHTQNPPNGYIEGLKSVGDGADEIVVSSVNENLLGLTSEFDILPSDTNKATYTSSNNSITIKSSDWVGYYGHRIPVKKGKLYYSFNLTYHAIVVIVNDNGKKLIEVLNDNPNAGSVTLQGSLDINEDGYIKIQYRYRTVNNLEGTVSNACISQKVQNYTPHQSDKKRLLYYNNETQIWEKPILREWDSIEKHANGKYYYHVRSKEGDYIEGDESLNDCITDLTVSVKKLAEEKVYECTNIDLITYANETNYVVNSGAISPKSTLKVHNNISNVVSLLQKKVSLLESNVKASQEVQDMMILETDMRMLDIELALMEFVPITLNLGGSDVLRSATYFNFLKNHIVNETYEKEYLENVMNKYLATGRINQDEYDELYKMLYPPVYDIELPIEY